MPASRIWSSVARRSSTVAFTHVRCAIASRPKSRSMRETISIVFSRVEPPAPYVTETKAGSRRRDPQRGGEVDLTLLTLRREELEGEGGLVAGPEQLVDAHLRQGNAPALHVAGPTPAFPKPHQKGRGYSFNADMKLSFPRAHGSCKTKPSDASPAWASLLSRDATGLVA